MNVSKHSTKKIRLHIEKHTSFKIELPLTCFVNKINLCHFTHVCLQTQNYSLTLIRKKNKKTSKHDIKIEQGALVNLHLNFYRVV